MKTLPLLLITGAACLAMAPAASAETFCVAVSNCPGTAKPDLQAALDAAMKTFPPDEILVGDPGAPLTGPFQYPTAPILAENSVAIKGIGPGRPVLAAPPGETAMTLSSGSLEGVDVQAAAGGLGLDLGGARIRDVVVRGAAETGIRAQGETELERVDVRTTGTVGVDARGLVTADRLRVDGATVGVSVGDPATLRVKRSRLAGAHNALASRGNVIATASVMQSTAPDGSAVSGSGGGLSLDHVTLAPRGGAGAAAVELTLVDIPGRATLSAVAMSGYRHGIVRDTSQTGGEYPVAIRDSVWDSAHDAGGPFDESGNAHVDPALVGGADLRPRGSSAAIDRDSLTDPRYLDLDGGPAVGPRADAGAFEYRRGAPRIDAVDVPDAGGVDVPLAFGATASDPDGDRLSLAWVFDDGDVAAGAKVTHAFGQRGLHDVTLRVRDEAGLTATRNFTVAVGGDRTAPVLSAVRLSKLRATIQRARGLRLRFRVSEAARVRIVARGRAFTVAASAGVHSVPLRRLKLKRPGRVAIAVSATDAAGNASGRRVVRLRLRR